MHTQVGLSYKYSYNKICTIPYSMHLISNRANFAVCGPTSFTCVRNAMHVEFSSFGEGEYTMDRYSQIQQLFSFFCFSIGHHKTPMPRYSRTQQMLLLKWMILRFLSRLSKTKMPNPDSESSIRKKLHEYITLEKHQRLNCVNTYTLFCNWERVAQNVE